MPTRKPPVTVLRMLSREVGYGCPVEGCGSPYLTWHHFDPPWSVENHHRPEGMIALCRDHHPEADAGAFTSAQLREFKANGRDRELALQGRFSWMRQKLLAVVGGNFYYEVPIALQILDKPIVWFNRDETGRLLVNLQGLTTSGQPRIQMIDNFWITEGSDESDIECPPSGRRVRAKYPNGDELSVEFREVRSVDHLDQCYPMPGLPRDVIQRFEAADIEPQASVNSHAEAVQRVGIEFPIASVEITMKVAGTDFSLGRWQTSIASNQIVGVWMVRGPGVQIG